MIQWCQLFLYLPLHKFLGSLKFDDVAYSPQRVARLHQVIRDSSPVPLRGTSTQVEQIPILPCCHSLLQVSSESLLKVLLQIEVVFQDQSSWDIIIYHVLPNCEVTHEASQLPRRQIRQ